MPMPDDLFNVPVPEVLERIRVLAQANEARPGVACPVHPHMVDMPLQDCPCGPNVDPACNIGVNEAYMCAAVGNWDECVIKLRHPHT